ncbi:MAG: cell wall hydrolase, partial [Sphingobium sp.]
RERLPDQSALPDADVFLILVTAAAGSESFVPQAQRLCAGRGYCKVIGWTDDRRKPDRLPMPGIAVDAISFTFTRSAAAGPATARWNCAEFPRADPAQCLRRGI